MVEILGMLILFLTNFISGYSIYKIFFRKANILEKIVMPQVLSLIFTPVLFVILYFIFGFDISLYILPITIIIVAFFCTKIKQETYKIQIEKKFLIWLILFICAVSLMTFYIYLYGFSDTSGDVTWHMSIANEIKNLKVLPPFEPCLYGTIVHYQWFWHLMLALVSTYSTYSVFQLMPFFSIYIAILSLTSSYILCYHYFKDINLSMWGASLIFLMMFEDFLLVGSSEYMLPLIVLFLYSFILFIETKSNKFAFLTGIIAVSFTYFHGFSFTFAALTLLSYLLYKITFEFHKIYKQYKREIVQLIVLFSPMIFAIPYYLIIKNAISEIYLFRPFTNLLNIFSIEKFNLLLIVLPFSIVKIFKTKNETTIIFLSLIITLFIFANTFIMERQQGIDRYFYFMAIPIAFITLDYLRDLSPIKRNAILIAVILILSYQFLMGVYFAPYHHPTKIIFELDEYFASKWINQNTNKDETILVSPEIENGTAYTAISERRAVTCHSISMASGPTPHTYLNGTMSPISDYKKYFGDVILMYTHPSQDKFIEYNVSYVLLCNSERSFFDKYDLIPYDFEHSQAFEKVFNSSTCNVFKLVNQSELPYTVNKSFVAELNFTSYSRWWSVF